MFDINTTIYNNIETQTIPLFTGISYEDSYVPYRGNGYGMGFTSDSGGGGRSWLFNSIKKLSPLSRGGTGNNLQEGKFVPSLGLNFKTFFGESL